MRPAVDFSALEEVLVVLTPTPAREAAQERPRVKAAGVILATAVALALQTTLARFLVAARSPSIWCWSSWSTSR